MSLSMWFERLLLSGINSKRIEDEPNGRADVIDALIISPNSLLFELSIPDGSRNRQTLRGFYVRSRSQNTIADLSFNNFNMEYSAFCLEEIGLFSFNYFY